MSGKCYAVVQTLARLRQLGCHRDFIFSIYRSLFEPVLFYGVSVWGSTYENVLNRFQVIQNDAIRAILGWRRDSSVSHVFKLNGLLNVHKIAQYNAGILMFKHIQGKIKLDFIPEQPPEREVNMTLRSQRGSVLLIPQRSKSVMRDQSPGHYFVRVWNSLPAEAKAVKTLAQFKEILKSTLLNT